MWRACVTLVAVLGCNQASGGNDPPASGRTKYHMRQHFNDLRTIERMLVAGKLDDAKLLAYMIARPSSAMPHGSEAAAVVLAAGGLRRGPRVTQIDRTVKHDKDEEGQ